MDCEDEEQNILLIDEARGKKEEVEQRDSERVNDEDDEIKSDSATKHPLLRSFQYGSPMKLVFGSPLGDALKHATTDSICSGDISVQLATKAAIRLLPGNQQSLGSLLQPHVDKILELTKPSHFGKGDQTVYDETVRKGLELVADQFSIDNEQSILQNIKQEIHEKLFPSLPGGVEAIMLKRYKMALYQEGGHFQFHRDSLHADNHQATLLVEVRSAHEGGKFVIDHAGAYSKRLALLQDMQPSSDLKAPTPAAPETTKLTAQEKKRLSEEEQKKYHGCSYFDFNKIDDAKKPLKWLAFYTDALHMVERVESGTRIVIQYDVYLNPDMTVAGNKANSSGKDEEDEDEYVESESEDD